MSNMSDLNALEQVATSSDARPGSAAMSKVFKALDQLADTHPEWNARFEDVGFLDTAEVADLTELLESAPTEMARGYLAGVIIMRLRIADMTGQPLF